MTRYRVRVAHTEFADIIVDDADCTYDAHQTALERAKTDALVGWEDGGYEITRCQRVWEQAEAGV